MPSLDSKERLTTSTVAGCPTGLGSLGAGPCPAPLVSSEPGDYEVLGTITSVLPDGPFHLIGHSGGGVIAFEMAQQLLRRSKRVDCLVLIDTYLPKKQRRRPSRNARAPSYPLLGRTPLRVALSDVLRRPRSAVMRWLRRSVLRHIDVRRRLFQNPDLLRDLGFMLIDELVQEYQPATYPGRVHFFGSGARTGVPQGRSSADGWAELALGGLDVRELPGGHVEVVREPLANDLAKEIFSLIAYIPRR